VVVIAAEDVVRVCVVAEGIPSSRPHLLVKLLNNH